MISVVMINYNGMPWLRMSAESVLANRYPDFELVIVDDCSKDDSPDYIHSLGRDHHRVKPVLLDRNQGISGARNAGIDAASGDYIALIDSDDRFLPDTLDRQISTFLELQSRTPGLSMLMSDAWLINEKGERVGRYISRDWWGKNSTENPPLWTLPSTFFFKKDHSARFHTGYRSADGPIFVSRMASLGPLAFTGEPLIEYRLRMSSVTNASGARMLREMKAAELSKRESRLDDPFEFEEVQEPTWREVAAWVHGRNSKNAKANGKPFVALSELAKATIAQPMVTLSKLWRSFKTYGRRHT